MFVASIGFTAAVAFMLHDRIAAVETYLGF